MCNLNNKVFSEKILNSLITTPEKIRAAIKKGKKITYDDPDWSLTAYKYKGEFYITEINPNL